MRHFNRIFLPIFLLAAFSLPATTHAKSGDAKTKKWVIVAADGIGLLDIADPSLVNVGRMLGEGAVGLMNTRAASRIGDPVAACATIGAGVRASGSGRAALSANAGSVVEGVNAGETFEVLTGVKPPAGSVVNLGIASLLERNARNEWKAQPGLLGSTLSDFGYTTSVVGNSDTAKELFRRAAMIVMDARGIVRRGDVSHTLLAGDPRAPFGISFDDELLKEAFMESYLKSTVTVVDFGETARVEAMSEDFTEEARRIAMGRAVRKLDAFLGFALRAVDLGSTRVMLLAPTPSALAVKEKRTLTPVLLIGPGVKPGLLVSASTRRAGIVANTDVAPTVLAALGVEQPTEMLGAPMESAKSPSPLAYLLRVHDKNRFIENHSWVVRIVLFLQLGVLLLAYVTTLLLKRAGRAWLGFMRLFILIVASADLALLLVARFDFGSTGAYLAAVAAIIGIVVGLLLMIPGAVGRLIALSGLYIAAILLDQLTGATLISRSVLGYYLQIGARYYGLGNEYSGFLIGGPLVFVALLLDAARGARPVRAFSTLLLLFVIVVVGAPQWGADTGGVLSCGVAFLFMIWMISGGRLSWRGVVFAFIVAGALVTAFVVFDSFYSGNASHLGKLVARARAGGMEEVTRVALRKIGTNLHLLAVSTWRFLFTALSLIAVALYFFPMRRVEALFLRMEYFRSGFIASMVGVAVAFMSNDSGIAPGGTCLILPLAAIFTLLFSKK